MWNALADEAQSVVFVSDRNGPALRRRERCLRLAAIPFAIEAERRPSGTYYKLCVRESDAVAAHLALQMGGCGRTLKLQQPARATGVLATLIDVAQTMWDEMRLAAAKLIDWIEQTAPKLLAGPRRDDGDD
jgi:hypothetical protein